MSNIPRKVDDSILKRNQALRKDKGSFRWWLETDPEKKLESLWNTADRIRDNLAARHRKNFLYALMYNDVDTNYYAANATNASERVSSESHMFNRITLNVFQNCVDTATSMVATDNPQPLFLTDGTDDYSMYSKAKKMTLFVQGLQEELDLNEKNERVFTDGGIFGTGAIKFYVDWDEKKVKAEHVNLNEILVDELEGYKENPSQIMQEKLVSRDQLIDAYPEFKDKIIEADALQDAADTRTVSDMIPVLEAWHMKSGKNAKDGNHVIAIRNAILFDEEYEKQHYPIIFWRWYPQTGGFWGRGIGQQIGRQQRALNKLMQTIDLAQELVGMPIILAPKSAMIVEDHLLSNDIARLIEYFGEVPPQFLTPPAVQGELYSYRRELIQEMYDIVGINRGMAQGQKDPSLKSGSAIREATDVASSRLQKVAQRWEKLHIHEAQLLVDLSKDLYERYPDLSVQVTDDDRTKTITWKEVDMERDRYKISCFEVSALPKTPQGRLETISEWGENGWIPKEVMMSLLNIPDLKRYSNLETATADLVQATISRIKDENRYDNDMKPIDQMNCGLALKLAAMEKVLAKNQGLPQDVLSKLDNYLEDINHCKMKEDQAMQQQQQAMQPPPQPQQPMPGPPQQGPPQQQ